MNINSTTSPTSVWNATVRTLSTAANTFTGIGTTAVSLGAGITLDLRPAAGVFRHVNIFGNSQASNHIGLYDGSVFTDTTISNLVTGAANNATVGVCIKNGSAGALNVSYCGFDMA